MKIPKQKSFSNDKRIKPAFISNTDKNLLFSFCSIEKNQYFNLDATCVNWSKDLFDTLLDVSKINIDDVYAGKYSGKNTKFRIHPHKNVVPPCKLPESISINDMWQIRISKTKGGIHGVFYENIFYVIWFDPNHNLYPDKNHGGVKLIKHPAQSCCKDRDNELIELRKELEKAQNDSKFWEEYANELLNKYQTENFNDNENK